MFAVALLASGQNSTLTGTLAGQIVMEGFMTWKIRPFYRRIITRLIAIVPAVVAVSIGGDAAANELLILSQVTLSVALPFAVFPLVHVTSDISKMNSHANSWRVKLLGYCIAFVLLGLNLYLFASG